MIILLMVISGHFIGGYFLVILSYIMTFGVYYILNYFKFLYYDKITYNNIKWNDLE